MKENYNNEKKENMFNPAQIIAASVLLLLVIAAMCTNDLTYLFQ